MLKLWTETSKDNECHSTTDLDGTSPSAQLKDAGMNSSSSITTSSGGPICTKRPHEKVEPDSPYSSIYGRPSKIPKTAHGDSLRTHLPEVVSSIQDNRMSPTSLSTFRACVLDQAKHENTANSILVYFVHWAAESERKRRLSDSCQPRTALLVVEHEKTANEYLDILSKDMPLVSVSRCMTLSAFNKPKHIFKKDIYIIQSQVLLDAMTQGFLMMDQIHTLVIGDIESIRELDSNLSLPIVQIMNGFYLPCSQSSRPRIFALALPAIDRWTLYDSRILKLEATLNCKIFGISEEKRQEILSLPERPNETIILYEPSIKTDATPLFKQLHHLDPKEVFLRNQFMISRYVQTELGSCAADLVWRRALKSMGALIHAPNTDEESSTPSSEDIGVKVRGIIKNWAFTMCNLDPTSHGYNVTHKFRRLVEVLQSSEPYGEAFRAVIFVRRRAIALILCDLLRNLEDKLHFVRPCALTGRGSTSGVQHQLEVYHGFSSGKYNVLIATKSVEDLDIPKAVIVVRYDVFDSQISMAFSRACTQGRESYLIHMIERGNCSHRRILSNITNLDIEILRWSETLSKSPESSIPPMTLSESGKAYRSDSEDEDGHLERYIEDPTTSGRIYMEDSVTVIHRFAACSQRDKSEFRLGIGSPLFTYKHVYQDFGAMHNYTCGINLPGSLINSIIGPPSPSKTYARRAVCFKACEKLANSGLLDCELFPTVSTLPVNDTTEPMSSNAEEAKGIQSKAGGGLRCYPRKLPDFWQNTEKFTCKTLHPTIIYISYRLDGIKSYAPIILFARRPIPHIPAFRVFSSGSPVPLEFYCFPAIDIDEEQLDKLHGYTTRIYRAIMNKPWSCLAEELLCFFAPLRSDWVPPLYIGSDYNIMTDVHWEAVVTAANDWAVPIASESASSLENELVDSIVQDRWVEFTRRYEYVRLRADMTPLSKPVDGPREQPYESLLDSCRKRRKGFEGLKDNNQPILEVCKVPALVNHLNPSSTTIPETRASVKYLIPELCAKFTVSASVMRTALLLPSILRRIDDLLLVKEVNAKFFNHTIRQDLLHMALCTPSTGSEYDYERLELLGDGFLKYLSSIYIFVTYPSHTEGMLHQTRQRIISNKSLLSSATNVRLPAYIQSKPFVVKGWRLPARHPRALKDAEPSASAALAYSAYEDRVCISLAWRQGYRSLCMYLNYLLIIFSQTIADVTEAIIGAAYISGGRETGLQVVKALSLPIVDVDQWSDLGRKVPLAPAPPTLSKIKGGSIEAMERIIGCKFLRPHLAVQALTQSLIPGCEITSFERLEFIGDAILDFMVIRYIFDREQHLSPGGLTLLKAAMVSNSALAAVCVSSGLHEYLVLQSHELARNVGEYATKLKARQKEAYKLAQEECRSPGQYWYDIEPPKSLSDLVESIIGAVYISDDFSPHGAEALFDNILKPFYDKHITIQTLSHHPTKSLLELLQATGCLHFEIEKEKTEDERTRCNVLIHDTVLSTAEGSAAANTVKLASMFALDALEGDPDFMKRVCDCRVHGGKGKGSKGIEDTLSALES
ncbi:hypothetical protein BDQ17DRAFT_1351795 [Cyathus striatus]|nr:hypothetical protein BDQ17DRAFT_1351795 [Cyathus striatus]